MEERTDREILLGLLIDEPDVDRIGILTKVVLDLMMEIECMRNALLQHRGEPESYRKSYWQTGLLSHDSHGPSGGLEKVLGLFYPDRMDKDGRLWREALMLRRMGSAESEIAEFKETAARAELNT